MKSIVLIFCPIRAITRTIVDSDHWRIKAFDLRGKKSSN